uniref:Uncharacterized protein n=1 Tax=Plectus sambesii TaxID=2011161 RepID=A0A914V4V2_9BILA
MESGAFETLLNPDAVYRSSTDEDGSPILLTDVVVIGNGPSGLALSAFLAGWKPFYNKKSAHPSRVLHQKLMGHAETSLVDQVGRLSISFISSQHSYSGSTNRELFWAEL